MRTEIKKLTIYPKKVASKSTKGRTGSKTASVFSEGTKPIFTKKAKTPAGTSSTKNNTMRAFSTPYRIKNGNITAIIKRPQRPLAITEKTCSTKLAPEKKKEESLEEWKERLEKQDKKEQSYINLPMNKE